MVNVSNPNTKSLTTQRTSASNIKKVQKKRASQPRDRDARADTKRGARTGLLPTSGPRAALSKKKARKMEKRMAHALRRRMEEEGEVEMKDAEVVEEKGEAGEKGLMEVEEEIA